MTGRGWCLGDITLGGLWYFLREKSAAPPEVEVFKVVAICKEPTVTIENIATGARETHAITSPNFGRYVRLGRIWSDGSRDQ